MSRKEASSEGAQVRSAAEDQTASTSPAAAADLADVVTRTADALLLLGRNEQHPVAMALARLLGVVANEANRNHDFAAAVRGALTANEAEGSHEPAGRTRRSNRRAPGPLDPFGVVAEVGEAGLRERLLALDLEQLRDIVAEHGMDHDRLAMRWKDEGRVVERIVDKVRGRNSKGSAFRTTTSSPAMVRGDQEA